MFSNKSLFAQASVVFSVSTVSAGVRFLSEMILARIMSLESFGLYGLIVSIVAIVQEVMSGGIRTTLQRYLTIYYESQQRIEFFSLLKKAAIVFVFISLLILLVFNHDWMYWNIEIFNKTQPYLAIIFIMSVLTALIYILADMFRCIGNIRSFVFFKEMGVAVIFLLLVFVIWLLDLFTLNWVLIIFAGSLFITVLWALYDFKRLNLLLSSQISKNSFSSKHLLYFWASAEVLGIIWIIRDKISLLSVSEYMTSEDVALLFIMLRTAIPIYLIKASFNSVISPVIASLYHAGRILELNSKYKNLMLSQFILIFPLLAVLTSFGSELIAWVFGDKYEVDSSMFSILICSISASVLLGPSGVALQMCGRPNIESFFIILSLLLIVPANIFLIKQFGLLGAIVATYSIAALIDLLRYLYVRLTFSISAHTRAQGVKIVALMFLTLFLSVWQLLDQYIRFLLLISVYAILFYSSIFSLVNTKLKNGYQEL